MSALKRFAAGFANSLAEQKGEARRSKEEEDRALRMQEANLKLAQKYERNYEVEERNGELVKVAYSGEGIEIPALTRKLDPTQAEEYRSKGLVAKASAVSAKDTIQFGASDAAQARADALEDRKFKRNAEARADRSLGLQEQYYKRNGSKGEKDSDVVSLVNEALYKNRSLLESVYPTNTDDPELNEANRAKQLEVEQDLSDDIVVDGITTSDGAEQALRVKLKGGARATQSPSNLEGVGILKRLQNGG